MKPQEIEEIQKKKAMLRAMLAGVPTKESEQLKQFTNSASQMVVENGSIIGKTKIVESASNFPSATELNQREIMGSPKEVPVDAISALLSGNKEKAKMIAEEAEREIPADKFNTRKVLQERLASTPQKQSIKENILPKSKLIDNEFEEQSYGFDKEEVRKMIAEEVEKVVSNFLGEVFEVESKRRQLKENIVIKIGETLFSGELRPLPKKAKKK